MIINTIRQFFDGLYYTNLYGYQLGKAKSLDEKRKLRLKFSNQQIENFNFTLIIENEEKLPKGGQYLLVSNHRSVIDPPIIERTLENAGIFGSWISKKELFNSFFFGLFVRNAGSILLDREKSQMSGFFSDIKEAVKRGESIFIFPEGTRNKTDAPLTTFKEGSRIIALKNRLPILPIYIKTNLGKALENSLKDRHLKQDIVVVIGDIIDYKNKTNLEILYREMFGLPEIS